MDEDTVLPIKSAASVRRRPGRVIELEDELRETLGRYEMIFRATNDVVYDLNFLTSNVVWNEALFTQFGYNQNERAGNLEWWARHIHPDDAMDVEQAITTLLESSESNWNHEYRFRKSDGSYADVHDRGYILRAANGSPQRIIGSFLDISHQKQLERAKDEFSSLISHQLRTPLTVIRIYSELLSDGTFGSLTDSQAKEISKIHSSSVKLIELVNDILAISSVELQSIYLVPTVVDINELVETCLQNVLPLAQDKSVTMKFVPNKDMEPIMVDTKVLEQVLHNLLTNAIRYTVRGTGAVVVSAAPKDRGCLITVEDNGIGIPLADRPHVYERFYRANNAVNSEEHGTGLGLYYVQLVIKALGGKVWFKSSRDPAAQGTTFYVYVPATSDSKADIP